MIKLLLLYGRVLKEKYPVRSFNGAAILVLFFLPFPPFIGSSCPGPVKSFQCKHNRDLAPSVNNAPSSVPLREASGEVPQMNFLKFMILRPAGSETRFILCLAPK